MADDLQGNLQNYKLQLQQVEAALTSDTDNEELKKLKIDLEEVIDLTLDLIKTQIVDSKGRSKPTQDTTLASKLLAAEQPVILEADEKKQWKVGDRCLALLSKDGLYYEALIEDILEDTNVATVTFDNEDEDSELTAVSLLREIKTGANKPDESGDGKSKKAINSKHREYQKIKKQKKLQRFKAMEEEREGEKNKWLQFSKKKKGVLKKSIFASPDTVNGRVGVGTCGTSGKPMTEYTTADKWRKGMD